MQEMREDIYTTSNDISETKILRNNVYLLSILLKDYNTKQNIKWATDSYINYGIKFQKDKEITADLITGIYDGIIQPRINKEKVDQKLRTKVKAEVYTPSWIVKLQVEKILKDLNFLEFEKFINTKWIEITCGEAPYMANRYDMINGEVIELNKRCGFIDKKLQLLNEKVDNPDTWWSYAIKIYKSSYGYEYQGDSLLIARENLLLTFIDFYIAKFDKTPDINCIKTIAEIICKNLIQMDGLTGRIPYSGVLDEQLSFFEEYLEDSHEEIATFVDWSAKDKNYIKGVEKMKFDVAIGNPPFQENNNNRNRDDSIYYHFLENSYKIASKSIMISPARFLFDIGSTPTIWNQKMLNDPHLKVIFFEGNSKKIFENISFEGGVAVTYRDSEKNFGAIDVFTPYPALKSILNKVNRDLHDGENSINRLMYVQNKFNLHELYVDYPNFNKLIGSKGREKRLTSSIFTLLPEIFHNEKIDNSVRILGREGNKRVYKYIDMKYLLKHENLYKWKVFVPAANGSNSLGSGGKTQVIGEPIVGKPLEGHTQTFISIGNFDYEFEANACEKYLKTKFARSMLGIKKVTQNNKTRETWSKVPLQNFSENADIDWSKSIKEIDEQLYKKYNLSEEEIQFIEENVKEME